MTLTRDILRLLAAVNDRHREDVSLSALSVLVHRSRFNLHRRFVKVVGETPKAYTSRSGWSGRPPSLSPPIA